MCCVISDGFLQWGAFQAMEPGLLLLLCFIPLSVLPSQVSVSYNIPVFSLLGSSAIPQLLTLKCSYSFVVLVLSYGGRDKSWVSVFSHLRILLYYKLV